jgi:Holliday junction resolvase RusA-like endonuclease
MRTFSMSIPGRPKTWDRTAGSGRRNTKAYTQWKKDVALSALCDGARSWGKVFVVLRVTVYLKDRSGMGDVDNYAKGIQDALEGIIYDNDRQVCHLDVRRYTRGVDKPRVDIKVEEVDDTLW